MATVECLVFEEPGETNTHATLEAGARRARELGIEQMVVATTTGRTALAAAEVFDGKIIGVTLQAGVWQKYAPPDPEVVAQAEAKGVIFLTCPHALMGSLDTAVKEQFGGLPPGEMAARTYYTICQGAKVAVECVMMAADAGLLAMAQEVMGIAGTNGGADTAMVITPAFTNSFFDLRVREFVAKPW